MKFFIVFSLLIFVCDCQNNAINFELKDVYTEVGQNAVVPCKFTTELTGKPQIKWFRMEEGGQARLFAVDLETLEVIRDSGVTRNITINPEDATLTFPSVTLEDNKRFSTLICEVDFGAPADETKSLKFNVVLLPEQNPETTLVEENGIYTSTGDNQIIGSCTSGRGYPAPKIEFYRDTSRADGESTDQGISDELRTDEIENPNGDGTFTTTRTLHYNITEEDDEVEFSCKVKGGSGDKTSDQTANFPTIRVNHPTKRVEIVQMPKIAYVGDEVQYNCIADGYPEPDINLDQSNSDQISIRPSVDELGRSISCSAGNEYNSVPVTKSIEITALYSIDPSISGDNNVNVGSSFTLRCNSGGNPEPNYKWLKDSQELEETTSQLQVDVASFEDSGEYKCEISFNDHATLDKTSPPFQVSVSGLVFDTQPVDVLGAKHKTVDLKCEAQSNPRPTFKWTRNGEEVSVETRSTKNGSTYTSILKVGPLDHTLSKAAYNCTVENSVSESMTKSFVLPEMVQPSSQASSPVAAIIIVVIILILVALVVLAVLYNKGYIGKKKPKEETKEEKDENNEEATASPDDDVEAAKTPEEEPKDTEKLVPSNGEQQQN